MKYQRPWRCLTCMGEHWSDEEREACFRKSRPLTYEQIRKAFELVKSIDLLQDDGKEA